MNKKIQLIEVADTHSNEDSSKELYEYNTNNDLNEIEGIDRIFRRIYYCRNI